MSTISTDRMPKDDHLGRNVMLLGCAGIAAYWLMSRGRGWDFLRSGQGTSTTPTRRVVWVRSDRVEVDGVHLDLPNVIAVCRAAGEAEVHATGDAIMRNVRDVVVGLRAAGVTVYLANDLARTNWETL
jgi:hypothetical protein